MKEYTLKNELITVKFLDFGGSFTYIGLNDDNVNLIANYRNKNDYIDIPNPYLNALVGPYAGRIKDGKCDGFELSKNNGINHLHGGITGVSKQFFTVDLIDKWSARLTLNISHIKDGYPGMVNYEVIYRLKGSTLEIDYTAKPMFRQPLNMTTHLYFNLNGDPSKGIDDHILHIPTQKRCSIGNSGAPEFVEEIIKDGTFDFNNDLTIGQHYALGSDEFILTRAFDCPYLLEHHYLTLKDFKSNKMLHIESDAPCVVVYTANYFDSSMIMDNGKPCKQRSYVALELQDVPNGMNIAKEFINYYDSEHPYKQLTRYTFSRFSE